MEKEIRNITAEIRKTDTNTIQGTAMTFNQPYNLGEFYEQIAPEALSGVIERSDIFAYLDHDPSRGVLARSNKGAGSLKLSADNRALNYEFKSGKSALHTELLEYLERGEITSSSFAFTVSDQRWEKRDDGKYLRTITKFDKLFDVSPVFNAANPNTVVSLRSLEEFKKTEKRLEPNPDETVEEFIPRCVAYVMAEGEAADEAEATTMCQLKWDEMASETEDPEGGEITVEVTVETEAKRGAVKTPEVPVVDAAAEAKAADDKAKADAVQKKADELATYYTKYDEILEKYKKI